jgi:hypothetical protein
MNEAKLREEIAEKLHELATRCSGSKTPVWLDPYTDFFITHLKAQDSLNQLIKEIEGMIKEWESEPPKPGYEDGDDGTVMYQCGLFDGLHTVLETISKLKGE